MIAFPKRFAVRPVSVIHSVGRAAMSQKEKEPTPTALKISYIHRCVSTQTFIATNILGMIETTQEGGETMCPLNTVLSNYFITALQYFTSKTSIIDTPYQYIATPTRIVTQKNLNRN